MYSAEYFIKQLNLEPHVEGGYFKANFASSENITSNDLRTKFEGERMLWTSIYFLLRDGEVSNFHRLKSDELWYYHAGSPLTIHIIDEDGVYKEIKLGINLDQGEVPQALVPKNSIFGSSVMDKDTFSLVGCMVSPGFEYKDFELFTQNELLLEYPQHKDVIMKMAYEIIPD